MSLFCKHVWEVLSETTTESVFEHAIKTIRQQAEGRVKIPPQLCDGERHHIQVVTCRKCGKLHRFVEHI